MATMSAARKSVVVFLAVAFGFAIAIGLFLFVNGGLSYAFALPALIVMMFSPSLGAIIATKFVNHESLKVNGVAKSSPKYYLVGWAYPFVFLLIGLVMVLVLGTARVRFENLTRILPTVPGFSSSLLLILTLVNLLLAPFINFIPALGEEYGWRGFLQPELSKRFGTVPGLTLTGIIWGLWHSPIILQGYNYPQHPNLIGVGLFTLWTVLVGHFLGWLRIRSKSCFPTALCHGAINAYVGFGIILAPTQNELLGLPLGLPGFLALALVAALVLYDISRHS